MISGELITRALIYGPKFQFNFNDRFDESRTRKIVPDVLSQAVPAPGTLDESH